MPEVFLARESGDPEWNFFKKTCEVLIDKAYKDLKEGKPFKPMFVISDNIIEGVQVKVLVETIHRKD